MTDDRAKDEKVPKRPACPVCGSTRTQPFTHAGPGARVNMKCIDCGHLFRHPPRTPSTQSR
jgi:rubredoxin